MGGGGKKGLRKTLLTEEQIKKVQGVLRDLRKKAQLNLVILLDVSGQSIAHAARSRKAVREAISALVAGNFAAAMELSRMLGEEGFRCLFHEGQEYSVYACKVGEDFILLVVFEAHVRFGLVKLYTSKSLRTLEDLLQDVVFETEEKEEDVAEMPSEDELDALLEKLKEDFMGE